MNINEESFLRIFTIALQWRKAYDDSDPDVGMPPSLDSLLDDIILESKIALTKKQRDIIISNYREY